MCAFFFNSPRERFHTKLCPLSLNKKEKKKKKSRKRGGKRSTSPPLLVTRLYICVKRACVYTRGDVTRRRGKIVFRRNPNGRLFYLGFTSDTLNKTSSHGRRQKKKKTTTTQSLRKGEHEEEDEHSRAALEDESLSLSLSLSLCVVGRPQNLLPRVLSIRERYTR